MQHRPRRARDNPQLSDFTLLNHAVDMAAAADAYAASSRSHDPLVVQFLLGRSLELTLKAFAIHVGATESKLRALGHDISATLAYAQENGLNAFEPSAAEKHQIQHLSDTYKRKLFEYPLVGAYTMVEPRILRDILDRLLTAVCSRLWGQSRYDFERARAKNGLSIDPHARYF